MKDRYFATLRKGESYSLGKTVFIKDRRIEVTEAQYEYLRRNRVFAVEIVKGTETETDHVVRPSITTVPNGRVSIYYPKTVDYDFMQQRPHHILRHLAREGFDVVYHDFPKKTKLRTIEPGLSVVADTNNIQLNRPLVMYYTFPPHVDYIDKIKPDLVVFDSIDEPVGEFSHWATGYEESLSRADLVVASAKVLYNRALEYNDNVMYLPNSVDYEKFKTATVRKVPKLLESRLDGRKVIGFYGCVAGWLDLDLLVDTIKAMPEYQFLIVGPNNIGISLPSGIDNLIRIPHVPYDVLPGILSTFDVGLVPFKPSAIADSCNPLKMWEYMAGGKPVVVTNIKEAEGLPGVYHANQSNIRSIIKKAIVEDSPKLIKARQAFAEKNSWRHLCSDLGKQIHREIGAGSKEAVMNIAIAYSPNWSAHVALEVFSIFKNNKGPIKIFLLSDTLGNIDLGPICSYFGPGYDYEFLDMEKLFEEKIPSKLNVETRYTKYTLYRLLLPELVDVDKILYLDADTLVTSDIRPMYKDNLKGLIAGGCIDVGAIPMLGSLGFPKDTKYLNAGVLLLNLRKIRAEGIDKDWLTMVNKTSYTFNDQDIINLTCKNRVKVLENTYNSSISTGIADQPKIIHYAGEKPWNSLEPIENSPWDKVNKIYSEGRLPRIPKLIHYCWFGGKPKPEIIRRCINSWKEFAPDYKLIEWNESNFDVNQNSFVKEAFNKRKYAFVTDYVRLWALYNYGGIYMDGDVELLASIDGFLRHRAFTGHETESLWVTAIMGAEPEHHWIGMLLLDYKDKIFREEPNTDRITELSKPYLVSESNGHRVLKGDVQVYPVETFCPYDHKLLKPIPTERSHAVHHFAGTWLGRTKI